MDEGLIMDIWDTFKEYIPEKSKNTAAEQFVDFLLDNDISIDVLERLQGYDPHLDHAIEVIIDQDAEVNATDDDDDDDDFQEEGLEDDE